MTGQNKDARRPSNNRVRTATLKLTGMTVAQFIPDGAPVPTQVHLVVRAGGDLQFVIAFKSPDALMETLSALVEAGKEVWPASIGKLWNETES